MEIVFDGSESGFGKAETVGVPGPAVFAVGAAGCVERVVEIWIGDMYFYESMS